MASRVNQHLERVRALHPKIRDKALAAFAQARAENIGITCTSGVRTYQQQNALYAQGRTSSGRIVTNARAGRSYHNFGLALDFCVIRGGKAVFDARDPWWKRFVRICKANGLAWGGDFRSFPDPPHMQMRGAPSLASLRKQYPKGWRPKPRKA